MNARLRFASRITLIFLTALATAPNAALAQAPGAPAGDPEAVYKQHMSNGVKLFQDKNYEAAIAEFKAAYEAKPKASPLVNIALSYKALFNYPKAIEALETALSKHADTLEPKDKRAAQDAIAEMKKLLAYVSVKVTPDTATVSVDGEDLPAGATAKPIPLGPGTHKIAAHADGFGPAEASVEVVSGETGKAVTLKLQPNSGFLQAQAPDDKTWIAVDGKPLAQGKWSGFLPPGRHAVQFYKPGGAAYTADVTITVGRITEVKSGVGGVPVASGEALPMPIGPAGPPEKPKDTTPPMKGWYVLATADVFAALAEASLPGFSLSRNISNQHSAAGGAGGARFGYRVSNLAGFELMGQYANVAKSFELVKTDITPPSTKEYDYGISNILFGIGLRLMTKGRKARFVATFDAGGSYDWVHYDDNSGCTGCENTGGLDGYLNMEAGFELDFGGVLVGLSAHQLFASSSGLNKGNPNGVQIGESGQARVGLGLHVGYGSW